jgi:hypothetical protein
LPPSSDDAVHVHSVQEEYFYMMVNRCICGGPWLTDSQQVGESEGRVVHRLAARCYKCKAERTFHFHLDARAGPKDPVRQVNPTAEPSRALDVAEWIDLAEFYLGRIERLQAPAEKAQSLLDARQCLEEALKFYGPEDETPPAAALRSEESRRKASRQAAAFRRSTLLEMLERIPSVERLRKADAIEQKEFEKAVRRRAKERVGREWWEFWKLWKRR